MKKGKKLLLALFGLALAVSVFGQSVHADTMTVKSPYDETTIVHGTEQKGMKYVYGIDVSYHQGIIDWNKVKQAGVEYAIIRLGYAQLADGQPRLDTRYKYNMAQAKAAGLKVGIYFYSQATNVNEAQTEVNFILNALGDTALDLPIVYDAECGTQSNGKPGKLGAANLSKAEWTNVAVAFCDAVQSHGYQAMFYGSISKIISKIDYKAIDSRYQMWIARYKKAGDSSAHQLVTTQYPYSGNYEYWQYSDHGKVSGITPVVDLDILYVPASDARFNGAGIVGAASNTTNNNGNTATVNPPADNNAANTVITPADSNTAPVPAVNNDYATALGTMKTNKSVPIRTAAKTSAKQVKKLGKNAKVTAYGVAGSGSNTFIRVIYKSGGKQYKGYVLAKRLNPVVSNVGNVRKTGCTDNTVTLSWNRTSGATGYEVYMSNAKNGKYKRVATVQGGSTCSYTKPSLESNMIYYFKVRAFSKIGNRVTYSKYKETSGGTTAKTWKVKAKKADTIRKYAGTSYKKVVKVSKNASMTVVYRARDKKNKVWYKVQYKKGSRTYTGFIPQSSTQKVN